jgi:hypothetical protein
MLFVAFCGHNKTFLSVVVQSSIQRAESFSPEKTKTETFSAKNIKEELLFSFSKVWNSFFVASTNRPNLALIDAFKVCWHPNYEHVNEDQEPILRQRVATPAL